MCASIRAPPIPDVDPAYNTEAITVSGNVPTKYSIDIPSQGGNTFSSLILYLNTKDVVVSVPTYWLLRSVLR